MCGGVSLFTCMCVQRCSSLAPSGLCVSRFGCCWCLLLQVLPPRSPRGLCVSQLSHHVHVPLHTYVCAPAQLNICVTIAVKGIIADLRAPDWMLVQTQEKGSYRTHDVVTFLDWALPPAACPQDSIVVLLDWFSAHLSTEVAELVASKGHILLFHGGGVTGMEQVNAPRPYS